jgi:hypothetical protein
MRSYNIEASTNDLSGTTNDLTATFAYNPARITELR